MVERDKNGRFVKGSCSSPETQFKKGNLPWNNGKKHKKESKRKMSNTRKKRIKEGKIIPTKPMLGKLAWNKGKECIKTSKENHWNWKGGITTLNEALRKKSFWKIWREAVFLRDNFTCQNKNCSYCKNKIGVMIHPHHIKPVSLFPELVFKVDNGITYCAEYHLKSGLHKDMQGVKNFI